MMLTKYTLSKIIVFFIFFKIQGASFAKKVSFLIIPLAVNFIARADDLISGFKFKGITDNRQRSSPSVR